MRKYVAWRSNDRRPTGNETGRQRMSPRGNTGGDIKPLPQTEAKAMHAAMTITQAKRSEGNRGPGCRSSRVPADPTVRRRGKGGVDPALCRRNYRYQRSCLTRQPLQEKREQRNQPWPVEGFLFLQTVFPAVCKIVLEGSVADRADTLREAEQKRGRERQHHQKKMKSINPE